MFQAQNEPPPRKNTAIVAVVVAIVVAAAAGIVVWRPSLVGLGGSAPADAPKTHRPEAPKPPTSDTPDPTQVGVLETTSGRIVIEFLPRYAPRHTVAFQNMFRASFFDGTVFHRVIPKRVVQGGDPNSKDDNPYDDGLGQEWQRRIPAEISTKIRHTRGTVAAARSGNELDSATSQFFICAGNEPSLDGQYTIFGRVVEGMEVVDRMAGAPLRTDDSRLRERPVDPVRVTKCYLAPRDSVLAKGKS